MSIMIKIKPLTLILLAIVAIIVVLSSLPNTFYHKVDPERHRANLIYKELCSMQAAEALPVSGNELLYSISEFELNHFGDEAERAFINKIDISSTSLKSAARGSLLLDKFGYPAIYRSEDYLDGNWARQFYFLGNNHIDDNGHVDDIGFCVSCTNFQIHTEFYGSMVE